MAMTNAALARAIDPPPAARGDGDSGAEAGRERWAETIAAWTAGNAGATLKAVVIWGRGIRSLHKASIGLLCMTAEEAAAAARALAHATGPAHGVELLPSLTLLFLSRALSRGMLVALMVVQLAEDAASPLAQRLSLALEGVPTDTAV